MIGTTFAATCGIEEPAFGRFKRLVDGAGEALRCVRHVRIRVIERLLIRSAFRSSSGLAAMAGGFSLRFRLLSGYPVWRVWPSFGAY